jgi:hypothetical protein
LEVGIGRAGDRAVGFVAVKTLPTTAPALLAALVLLAGCNATVQVAAVVGGGAAGGLTANPAVGFAVGVAIDAGATYVVRYYGRTRQGAEQDAIAQVAGDLPIGTEAAWKIEHTIPIGDEHGQLRVVRSIDSPLAACKEIAFSVDEGKGAKLQRSWYISDVCKQAERWKWASAEPAVARWGYLQ